MANQFDGEKFGREVAREVKDFLSRAFEKFRAEVRAEVEERIRAIEETAPRVRGVFIEGEEYRKGALVVYSGSLWSCVAGKTQSKPGSGSDWLLVCKRGEFSR